MQLDQRITAFSKLGTFLKNFCAKPDFNEESLILDKNLYTDFEDLILQSKNYNAWFTEQQIRLALRGWVNNLSTENLKQWTKNEDIPQKNENPQKVAVIMAGNLPLVGFHDFLSVLITGHSIIAKLSSNDKLLLPYLSKILVELEPGFKNQIQFTDETLPAFDAVIATGSNNTARYFEYYFKDKPHIIRKNRNAVAVLQGNETGEQLSGLADDIFSFFGMGCRSVSKLFVPQDYDFDPFFNAIFRYKEIINHAKYANNYDYNKAVYLMGLEKLLDNNFLILKQDAGFSSPIAVLNYEYYTSTRELQQKLKAEQEKIQCIVSSGFMENEIPFGDAQQPKLWDYADGVNTVAFLSKLK